MKNDNKKEKNNNKNDRILAYFRNPSYLCITKSDAQVAEW